MQEKTRQSKRGQYRSVRQKRNSRVTAAVEAETTMIVEEISVSPDDPLLPILLNTTRRVRRLLLHLLTCQSHQRRT